MVPGRAGAGVSIRELANYGQAVLGSWTFDGAAGIACLCLIAAVSFYFVGESVGPRSPIPLSILDEAARLAAAGEIDRGIALLDQVLQLSPRLWQARQYRGQMRLAEPDAVESALKDFTEAIRLAPDEPDLYILRGHVFSLLGQDSFARADLEVARPTGWSRGTSGVSPSRKPRGRLFVIVL